MKNKLSKCFNEYDLFDHHKKTRKRYIKSKIVKNKKSNESFYLLK